MTSIGGSDGFNGIVFAGIFVGGYHYSLKMFTFEKVRARNFARAWGFVQFSQVIKTWLCNFKILTNIFCVTGTSDSFRSSFGWVLECQLAWSDRLLHVLRVFNRRQPDLVPYRHPQEKCVKAQGWQHKVSFSSFLTIKN